MTHAMDFLELRKAVTKYIFHHASWTKKDIMVTRNLVFVRLIIHKK